MRPGSGHKGSTFRKSDFRPLEQAALNRPETRLMSKRRGYAPAISLTPPAPRRSVPE
jgi:hypothetical protein